MGLYYVTFGTRYAHEEHPKVPSIHPDGVLEIEAKTFAEARAIAFAHLDRFWSVAYTQKEMAKDNSWRHFPRGVTHRIIDNEIKEITSG